jgi:hypothetical protein
VNTSIPKASPQAIRERVIDPVDKELSMGDPRSLEYRHGMIDILMFREHLAPFPSHPYQLGTAQSDAYSAGVERGHALWRRLQGAK